jgi:chromosomal replication initiation ATPase DnaA
LGYVNVEGGVRPCACQRERRILEELPPRFHQARLRDFPPTVVQQLTAWLESPGDGLLITGPAGTGKAHLAAAILRWRVEHGKWATFRRLAEFYQALRESYRLNTSEADVLRPYIEGKFVVLDDLGGGALSDFERRAVLEVLDRRLNQRKLTVVTTNWSLAEIAERVDDRVASRLASFTCIELAGLDRRLTLGRVNKVCVPLDFSKSVKKELETVAVP